MGSKFCDNFSEVEGEMFIFWERRRLLGGVTNLEQVTKKDHSEIRVDKQNFFGEKVIAKNFHRLLNMFWNKGGIYIIGFGGMDAPVARHGKSPTDLALCSWHSAGDWVALTDSGIEAI